MGQEATRDHSKPQQDLSPLAPVRRVCTSTISMWSLWDYLSLPLYKDWAGNMVAFFSCPPSPSINSASLQECDKKSFTTRWAIIWVVTVYRSPLVRQLLDLLPSPKSPCLLAPIFLAASWGLWVSLLYLMAVNGPFSISYLLSFWFPPSLLACPPFTFPWERAYADLQAWASNCLLGSLMGPKVKFIPYGAQARNLEINLNPSLSYLSCSVTSSKLRLWKFPPRYSSTWLLTTLIYPKRYLSLQ